MFGCLFLCLALLPSPAAAQDYDQLWKETESLQKKDLPKSVIGVIDKIYDKASAERNMPQMLKAYLVRADYRTRITPDSLQAERDGLEEWAESETDPMCRAVLNAITGGLTLDEGDPEKLDEAIGRFRLALADEELLGRTPATDFLPMTVSTDFSKKYFADNMFDLLSRHAIDKLCGWRWRTETKVQREVRSIYRRLADFYGKERPEAALLVELAELSCRRNVFAGSSENGLTHDEYIMQLRALADSHPGIPAAADAYVKLARAYVQKNDLVQAMQVIGEGIKKYPSAKEASETLRKMADEIRTPSLSTTIPFVYPGRDAEVELRYANLTGIRIDLYRLNLTPASEEANRYVEPEDLIRKHGKKIGSHAFALAPTADYLPADTVLRYSMPQPGIYMMKLVPQGETGGKGIAYKELFVSPYQAVLLPVSDNVWEFTAIDKLTGQPVPGAEIVTYDFQRNPTPHKTDGKGSLIIDISKGGYSYYNVRTPGNDFMPLSGFNGYSTFVKQTDNERTRKTNLFTDRSIYRPGQTVYVSGVVYEQCGDSTRALAGAESTFKLYSNNQDITEFAVHTDSLGVFSAEAVLPQNLLPGNFYATAFDHSVVIKVDEYKRPTFDVTFVPYENSYNMGDTIEVEGTAQTFAGAPVRSSLVKYRLTRALKQWFIPSGSGSELATGETRTDADGKFRVKICLARPETEADMMGRRPYYIYKLAAEVTSGAGETQEGILSLPVAEQSLGLQIRGLDATVMREKEAPIQFQALNLNGQPVKTTISYRVYTLDDDGDEGATVLSDTARSQRSFVPRSLLQLKSGAYRIKIAADDAQGRTCTAEQDFVLFSATDAMLPVRSALWMYQDGKTFEPACPPVLHVGSSETDACLFVDVYTGNKRIASERINLDNELKHFTYPYNDEYGDAIRVCFSLVKEGKLHQEQAVMSRPRPKKQLTLEWETFRDRLQPGGQEEWRLKITDKEGLPVKANLLATLYDASLDKLEEHDWSFSLYFPRRTSTVSPGILNTREPLRLYSNFPSVYAGSGWALYQSSLYSRLIPVSIYPLGNSRSYLTGALMAKTAPAVEEVFNILDNSLDVEETIMSTEDSGTAVEVKYVPTLSFEEELIPISEAAEDIDNNASESPEIMITPGISVRENFNETAFFYPNLRTDSTGRVSIVFTVPEALTEWRLMGFAHTQGMDYGMIDGKTRTAKDFMVQPNLPRFLRQGDHAVIAASLVNLSMEKIKGKAVIELSDPVSGKIVHQKKQSFAVEEGETGTVRFAFDVPQGYDVLVCKIVADAGDYSDGEQHYLPVLTDKEWTTETLPVQFDTEGEKTIGIGELFNHGSKTAENKRLTIELVANPDWYAVQALPVAGNPTDEDALSWATAYYANSLALAIVEANPEIRDVFAAWQRSSTGKESLLSNLERNADLKSLLLEETPWVTEATDETEQKRRIALLFDENTMNHRLQLAVERLQDLQLSDGSWSWYQGMTGSRHVTTQIVEMLARLKSMSVSLDGKTNSMYARGLDYLNAELQKEHEQMLESEKENKIPAFPSEQAIRYLYITALDAEAKAKADRKVISYMSGKLENRSAEYSIYEKSLIAVIMDANGKRQQADELIQSIEEYTVNTPEMGRYFDTPKAGYSWRSYRIPTQVVAMEAMSRLGRNGTMYREMKQWLLKQKQVQMWESPIATADAVYAFLCTGDKSLNAKGSLEAKVGNVNIQTPADALGYVRKTFTGAEAEAKQVSISKSGEGISWGAIYAQYLEDMDNLNDAKGNSLTITRRLLLDGKPITAETQLKLGDKLTVSLTVSADRDMDFICIKDERAACMEPANQLSGYRWTDGLGYFQVNRDAATEIFIDKMRKGTYTINYEVYIDRSGIYQAGTATVRSVYAPEFGGHTAGQQLEID